MSELPGNTPNTGPAPIGKPPVIEGESWISGPEVTTPGAIPHYEVTTAAPAAPGLEIVPYTGENAATASALPTGEQPVGQPERGRVVGAAYAAAGLIGHAIELAPATAAALDRYGALDAAAAWAADRGGRTGTLVGAGVGVARMAAEAHGRDLVRTDDRLPAVPPATTYTGRARVAPPARPPAVPTPPPQRPREAMPPAWGPFAGSWERGDVPRHLALDQYLGLDPQEYAAAMADTAVGRDGLTGPQRLAARAQQMQALQANRLMGDRPLRGAVDVNGNEIPYFGPALPPNVANGKQQPVVDRARPAVYGEPGAGWNYDPRYPTMPRAPQPPYDRSLDQPAQGGDPRLTRPERIRGVVRGALRGLRDRREERNWEAAREAGFDTLEGGGGLAPDDVRGRARGYVDVNSELPSDQSIVAGTLPDGPSNGKARKLKIRRA